MPKIQYIGKQPIHFGKSAFEILTHLKLFGLGRMLTRCEWDKYPEPSYHVIRRVIPRMDDELLHGKIWVETVLRARRIPGLVEVNDGYKRDFRLIHKEDEQDFVRGYEITNWYDHVKVLPKYYTVPPLMNLFLTRHRKECGDHIDSFDKIPFFYVEKPLFHYRIAEPGEPTYKGIDGTFKFNDLFLEGVKPI